MKLPILITLASCFPGAVMAHHGLDAFVTLDAQVPEYGHVTSFSSLTWSEMNGVDELALEPGFLVGIGWGIGLGAQFRYADEGPGGWDYSSATPLLHWDVPLEEFPFDLAISANYVFAEEGLGHEQGLHIHPPSGPGAGTNPDAPPPDGGTGHLHDHGSHSHSGIHRHGEDHFQMRLIAEWHPNSETRVVGNLIGVTPGSGEYGLGYALGYRRTITPMVSVGLEAIGDFDTHGEHELVAGFYFMPNHECTLRLGVGTGLGAYSSDVSLYSGITWRF